MLTIDSIFSSRARTNVLEVLARFGTPLHLRRIAALSNYSVHAIDKILKALTKDKLLTHEWIGEQIYFSLNKNMSEALLVINLIKSRDELLHCEAKPELSIKFDLILDLAETITTSAMVKRTNLARDQLLRKVISFINSIDAELFLINDFAANVYRKYVTSISCFDIAVKKGYLPRIEENLKKYLAKAPELTIQSPTKRSPYIQFFSSGFSLPIFRIFTYEEVAPLRTTSFNFKNTKIILPAVEDAIIELAKRYLKNQRDFQIIDNLQKIFEAKHNLDIPYLTSRIVREQIAIREVALIDAPKVLVTICKELNKQHVYFDGIERLLQYDS